MKIYQPEYWDPPENVMVQTGRRMLLKIRNAGRALFILFEALFWIGTVGAVWNRRKEVVRQCYVCGVKSLGVTSTVALFTGMILSLQAGMVMKDFGQQVNVGLLVSQTMCREMGPFMTALILAASVGSAMAAEIGTMNVSEEISALHVMSINPVRYLVMPRLLAMMIMCPALTVYTDVLGILGGMLVALTQLDVSTQAYYDNVMRNLHNKEVWMGILKSFVYAIILTTVACHEGLSAQNGAAGVGRATRQAVVVSFLLILITGYIITRFMV